MVWCAYASWSASNQITPSQFCMHSYTNNYITAKPNLWTVHFCIVSLWFLFWACALPISWCSALACTTSTFTGAMAITVSCIVAATKQFQGITVSFRIKTVLCTWSVTGTTHWDNKYFSFTLFSRFYMGTICGFIPAFCVGTKAFLSDMNTVKFYVGTTKTMTLGGFFYVASPLGCADFYRIPLDFCHRSDLTICADLWFCHWGAVIRLKSRPRGLTPWMV